MSNRQLQAACLFLAVFAVLITPMVLVRLDTWALRTGLSCLYVVVVLPLSVETMEILLAFAWNEPVTCELEQPPARRKTAVLMAVRDDWNLTAVASLRSLVSAGYDAFILDDSRVPCPLPLRDCTSLQRITRPSAIGAKAGNLNHWLRSFANKYEYAILLDSDSVMPVETADRLVLAADHPKNCDVALFQAKIRAAACCSPLARALGTLAKPRMRILSRVHSQLGWLLSFGHNQLVRLSAIRSIGDFDEAFTCEDTVLSLELARENWGIRILNAWSEDTEPEEFFQYRRRYLRWARQTLELFGGNWNEVPIGLKIVLCRHLFSYVSPIASMALFLLSIWSWPWPFRETKEFMSCALQLLPGYEIVGELTWLGIGFLGFFFVLRFVMSKLEGIPLRAQLRAAPFLGIPNALLIIPIGRALLTSMTTTPVQFIPTGDKHRHNDLGPFASLLEATASSVVILSLAAGVLVHPASLLVGLNAIWLAMILFSVAARLILWVVESRRPGPVPPAPATQDLE